MPPGGRLSEPDEPPGAAAPETVGGWFGPTDRPLCGWLSTPTGVVKPAAVLILPATGYQYWSAHRTLRVIAERLALAGHMVLRFDYDGTGDSGGDQWDAGRVEAWRASVATAVAELRALGAEALVLVGARLGGTLALLDGAALGADGVVAWEPVASGRRYAKELRMLATAVPADAGAPAGTIVAAGTVYTQETLDALEQLSLADLAAAPAPKALIVAGRESDELVAALRAVGCEAECRVAADGVEALEIPAEDAIAPPGVVEAICDWIGTGEPTPGPGREASPATEGARATLRDRVRLGAGDTAVHEEVVTLGPELLVGIIAEPGARTTGGVTAVFLNSGSEPHVGSGRAWVEFSRALAAAGHRCLRVDFRGWGESPDDGRAPGRPYDAHGEDDAVAVVRALHDRGHERVVLIGLCAGAWISLRVALRERLEGVVALNPQLYWEPGDPVEALMSDTRIRRTPLRLREERGRRWGVWELLDIAGHRNWAARWLDELVAAQVPTTFMFAKDDDGLEFLHNRVDRPLRRALRSGMLRVVELPDIDHSMHRVWLRGGLLDAIREQLDTLGVAEPARNGRN